MQMLSVPGSSSKKAIHDLEVSQNSSSNDLDAIDAELKHTGNAVSKEKEHNSQLAEHEKQLEENEEKLAAADEQIEENAKKAQTSIHMFSGILVIIVLVLGLLHNMWRGKL